MVHFFTAAFFSCLAWSNVLCQDVCYEKADVLFVIDASGSVGPTDFQKQLQFAATLVNNFQVGVTQFSVLLFDSTPTILFDFDDYKDNSALKNAILNVAYNGGGTDTAAALKLARTDAFTSARGSRAGVPKIVIVSTDGQSNSPNDTATEAQNLKNSNVLVLAIGVGSSFYKPELDAIATFTEDVFEVVDYTQLVSIVYDYSELVCRQVKLFNCNDKADVFFLLDSSSSITREQYQNELLFISNISSSADLLEISIGAATFGGSTIQKIFNLGQYNNQFQLSQALASAIYLGGPTDTDSALTSVVSQNVFGNSSGGRADATKILIIVTDGGSTTAAQAKLTSTQLRTSGVNIVAVGVSNPNLSELKDLVSHSVLDVVTNLAYYKVAADRVETLTALQECKLPDKPVTDVSNYCKENLLINGIHPHPYDCTQFIECTFLRTDIMPCPPNEVYDPIDQTCTYPGQAHSCNVVNPIQTQRPQIKTTPSTTAKPCTKGTLDILFVIDSSFSVGSQGFRDELRFAATFSENFHVGADGILFAATSFGDSSINLFNFDAYTEYTYLQRAILNATFQGGNTNTYLALENALNIFDAAHGSRAAAPDLVIVLSNGKSSDNQRTVQAATALKNAGVHIIVVGLSGSNLPELQAIASTPGEVFVNNFDGVLQAVKQYSNSTCGGVFICNGIQYADVIFVLDSSASITTDDYQKQLAFVADVTSKFTLGTSDVHFGAVVFSQETVKLFDLKEYTTPEQLKSAILSAQHLKSGTDTAKALNYVREQQMFSSNAGGRDNATKIVIVLTDGRSNSMADTANAAQQLKASGVKFIAVGIGEEIFEDELRALASDQGSLFLVAGYNEITQIQDSLPRKVCDIPKEPENVPDYSYLCSTHYWADGKHPNPTDCSSYVQCYSLTTDILYCPSGEAYDPIDEICKDPSRAHSCSDPAYFGPTVTLPPSNVISTKGPPSVDISSLCQDYQLVDGIYPDPGDCSSFVECTNFLTQHMPCPENLHFNTANDVCDDVHVVDCQVNFNYFVHS